jgi:hypothetical protein
MRRLLTLALGLALAAGCSSKDDTPHPVKDLRSRGLKDPSKDPIDPNAKPATGQPGGGAPKR